MKQKFIVEVAITTNESTTKKAIAEWVRDTLEGYGHIKTVRVRKVDKD